MRSLAGVALRAPRHLIGLLVVAVMLSTPVLLLAPAADAAPATTLSVDVVDANDAAIAGASVSATGGSAATNAHYEDDTLVFELAAGSYQLSFSAPGFTSAPLLDGDDAVATVVVGAGGSVTIGNEVQDDGYLGSMTLQSTPRNVSGVARGADNAGLAGITVQAVPEDGPTITAAPSGAGGGFTLALPIGTYTVTYLGAVVGNYTYVNTPYAGGQVVVTQTNTPMLDAQKLAIDDGSTKFDLKGTTSDGNGDALNDVTVTVLPIGRDVDVASDTTRTIDGNDGAYRIGVRPGRYRLRFDKVGYQRAYLENGVDLGPVTVIVSPTGTVSASEVELDTDGSLPDVTLLLSPAAMVQAPKLTGKAVVGQTLVVSTGTWAGIDVDTDSVMVEWFIGGQPADDYSDGDWFQKFVVPIEAVGKKIGYRITVDDPEGVHASSVFDGSTGVVPKATAQLKGAVKKGKLSVALTVAGVPKPTGSILVKDGKKTVATIKLKAKSKGKAVVALPKLKPGKHKLVLTYAGGKAINPAATTVKVVVKK